MKTQCLSLLKEAKKRDLLKRPVHSPPVDYLMEEFDLTRREAAAFTAIFGQMWEENYAFSLKDLIEPYGLSEQDYMRLLVQTRNLHKKGLVVFEKERVRKSPINPSITVDEGIFTTIISGQDIFTGCDFSDLFSITEFANQLFAQRENERITENKFHQDMSRLMAQTDTANPLFSLLKKYSLVEGMMLLKAINEYISGRGSVYISEFAEMVYDSLASRARLIRSIWNDRCGIIADRVIRLEEDSRFKNDQEFFLSEKTAAELFKYDLKNKKGAGFKSRLLRHLEHGTLKRKLFLNQSTRDDINRIIRVISRERFADFKEKMTTARCQIGIVALFHGKPGTGKTASAHMVAGRSKRDILQVDISRIRDCWVGNSEKNIRKVFDEYRRARKELPSEPILLFNEADALISRRMSVVDSVDQMNNTMQNILLEELENFEGIFIATTNLMDNLDKAFARRFLFKIRFSLPDHSNRLRIWKSKVPGLRSSDYRHLAGYEMTGADIENIARKVILESLIQGRDSNLEFIDGMIRNELQWKNQSGRNPIGFRAGGE